MLPFPAAAPSRASVFFCTGQGIDGMRPLQEKWSKDQSTRP
jgi:hypothetical protein